MTTPTPSLTTAEVLRKAADKISAPGAWTQGAAARNASGDQTSWRADDAVCWCVLGAIAETIGGTGELFTAAADALDRRFNRFVSVWNDTPGRTQSEVVSALLAAADQAEKEGR